MPRVIIVGAGISGLSLAFRLHQLAPNVNITVLEADSRIGGCVRTDHCHGYTIECGPNGFLDSKSSTLQLVHDVGMEAELIPASESSARNRYLFLDQGLARLPSGLLDLLRSPLLSVRGKLELLAEPFRRRNRRHGPESVASFARRRAGRGAADTFADALVTGIHGGDPTLLDVRAAFPRLVALEAEHGSVVRGMMREARPRGKMWSLKGGLGSLMEAIRDRLPSPPLLGVPVRRIERHDGGGWTVFGDGLDRWDADAVVLTCPAFAQGEILDGTDSELAELVGEIRYNRIAVVALGFRVTSVPPADGFGFIAPQRLGRDVLGVQWCSTIFPERAPVGTVLWRALCGGWNRPEIVDWPDERLVAAVLAELRLAQGVEAAPLFVHIVRWPQAIPQYLLGHPERVAAIEARVAQHSGLYLAGNAIRGVALNDCTGQSEILSRRVIQRLSC